MKELTTIDNEHELALTQTLDKHVHQAIARWVRRIHRYMTDICMTAAAWVHQFWSDTVRIRRRSHYFAAESSYSVDRAGWKAKMASIEFWIP